MPTTSYIQPHQRQALDEHCLVADPTLPGEHRTFRLVSRGPTPKETFVRFTTGGVVIHGDIQPGLRGVISERGLRMEGFLDLPEEALCEQFFDMRWQAEVAERDVLALIPDLPHHSNHLMQVVAGIQAGTLDEQGLTTALIDLRIPSPVVGGVGYDYPLADAGWLCAIRERFRAMYTG